MKDFIFQIPRKIEVGFSKSRGLSKTIKQMKINKVLIVVDYNLKKKGIVDYIFESTLKSQLQDKLFLVLRRKSCIIKEANTPVCVQARTGRHAQAERRKRKNVSRKYNSSTDIFFRYRETAVGIKEKKDKGIGGIQFLSANFQ